MRASYDWKVGSAVVKPEVRGQWQHEFGTESSPVDARFASGAGGVFTVHAPEVDRDSALVSAGLSVQWNKRVSTYVYYDGQLLRGNYDSHNVSGGLSVSF